MDEIQSKARDRGRQLGLPYAGAVLPAEAHMLMKQGAKLIDVRTVAERHFVGSVPGSEAIEWSSFPQGQRNPTFLEQLEEVARKDETILFLCRSGARSHHAAIIATDAGWQDCYNVLEGFEGDKDPSGHRGTVNGWRKAGLPWTQG